MVLVIASAIIKIFKTFSQEHARPIKYTTKQERRRSFDQSSIDNRNYILWTLHIILWIYMQTNFHRISWKTSQNRMKHVSSWSFMKISSYEVMFIFSYFGRIFIARIWFWLFNLFVKVVSLSVCSTLIDMRSGNQVENFSKFTIKFSKVFITYNFEVIFVCLFTFLDQ